MKTTRFTELLTLAIMAGMSFVGAAALTTFEPAPEATVAAAAPVVMLPRVEITAKRQAVAQLPAVVIVAKRATPESAVVAHNSTACAATTAVC